tara:strand:- start:839 stop:1105 length:267 start_codon:yes stop_codon:yes gene_type:complete
MEHECVIIDLAEERLKRYVDTFYQGSEEWGIAMQVLFMYLSHEIDVSWCAEGVKITHPSLKLQKENPEKDHEVSVIVLPPHGPAKKEQ